MLDMTRRFVSVLSLVVAGAATGCAVSADTDADIDDEDVSSAEQALTVYQKVAGPYGRTGGAAQGPGNDLTTPITKLMVWSDANYIHGIKLFWGTKSVMWGVKSGQRTVSVLGPDEYVNQVYVSVDPQGWLRALSFDSNLEPGLLTAGYYGGGLTPVLTGPNARMTDMTGYIGTDALGQKDIWGIKLNYTSN
jgi:hypothetical protein